MSPSRTELSAYPDLLVSTGTVTVPVWTDHRNQSLRYVLLTMDLRMSWDVRLSIQVHIEGRCDGAVDVGYRCQSGADSADHRGSDYRQQSLLEWRARLRPAVEPKRLSSGVGGPSHRLGGGRVPGSRGDPQSRGHPEGAWGC
jgi:hypothetical protein